MRRPIETGFFTSRVIGTFIMEGIAMLAEGVPAASIEQASTQSGYPAPVLQLSDELNLKLMRKIRLAAERAGGSSGWETPAAAGVIDRMLDEFERTGRLEGRGFPAWTGGVLQYINGYDGGLEGFIARAHALAAKYGERFEPPASLLQRAERGETFSDEQAATAAA